MKKLALITSCLIWFVITIVAQNQAQYERFVTSSGAYTVSQYKDSIYKINFQPNGYKHNESISDAVILKPETIKKKLPVVLYHDSLVVNHRFVIASTFHNGHYRGFNIALKKGEKIFGTGERALPLNRRGYHLDLYNIPHYGYGVGEKNLNYEVPFLTTSCGYGLFFDNVSKAYLDLGKSNSKVLQYGAYSGALTVYVIFGDYQTILHSYYQLTGTQPIPPRWAFGNLMSRFGYTSQAQVDQILKKMTQDSIPVDAVIFDLFWFGDHIKHTLGNLEWVDKKNWPDPKAMISGFSKQGIKTILVTEPYLVKNSLHYNEAKPYFAVDSTGKKPYFLTQFYFGNGGLLDLFRKDTQNWFWQFYQRQMKNGVEGWWGDLGEPETHPANMFHNLKTLGFKRLFSADEVHNYFGHVWTKMLFEKYAQFYPDKRLFSLNRSGYAGTQRYCIFPWTGDVGRNWSGLQAQLMVLLGMSMSGIPYVHSDAGGFAGGDGDYELYVRWLQFAAFTPIFRPHGTALYKMDTTAFSFPSEAALMPEPYRYYAKQAIYTRYRLLPYNYTLGYQQAKNGQPLISPLYYWYPNDTIANHIQDEYMWGDEILVAPVIEKGATTRTYYLPAGKWYSILTHKIMIGNQFYTEQCPLADIPYFYKEGSFIPEDKTIEQAGRYNGGDLIILYVPSTKHSSYDLFNDDGISKSSLKDKHYELIHFASDGFHAHGGTISIVSNHGQYYGKPFKRHFDLQIPMNERCPNTILFNGERISLASNSRHKDLQVSYINGILHCMFTFDGKPVTIKLEE
ncbi:TIM-barrel domain-containing protein [Microbacter margulisiae]|uniref:Oligosaccharide 4-alpha-D-glucosyltransferase n=1 Tax=Microbacter margulisiae TaxID=1350067 RepID=A0A7W5DQC7_9PORP|nr:TIM-barrel domain-containing protein [Microbacter margulisiae]MBB3187061.1 oligosaccharide 4-alpha-D-glucosyltransferase [Microbacter margulisiae]